jgi:putative flippase GtrA
MGRTAAELLGQGLRFVVGGGTNTVLTLLLYWLLLNWMPYAAAFTASFAAGILSGYAINTLLVFRAQWSWRKLMMFPSVHAVNYSLGLGIVLVSVDVLGVPARWAPLIATVCTLPVNFVLTRWLLLHPGRRTGE